MKILLFHVNIMKQSSIRNLCGDLGIEVRAVADEDLVKTIGTLAGMPGLPNLPAGGTNKVPFQDEMMVFCGADPDQLDRFLTEYRKREIQPVPLKAVLTPYNAGWLPGRLCAELKKEQQMLH